MIKIIHVWYNLRYQCTDLKGEGLIENRTKVLALNFGLKLLLLVWQHVDFDVRV